MNDRRAGRGRGTNGPGDVMPGPSATERLAGWSMGSFLAAVALAVVLERLPGLVRALLPADGHARQGLFLVLTLTVAGVALQALWRGVRPK